MRTATLLILAAVILAVPAFSASSYLGGFSGLIYTPDTLTVPAQNLDVSFHDTLKFFGGIDFKTYGGIYGLSPSSEVGVSFFSNSSNNATLSGKLRIVNETSAVPGVAVGVFDLTNSATEFSGNPSAYLVVSKDVTTLIPGMGTLTPIQVSLGAGSGVFNGIFASLDYAFAPTFSAQVEFNGGHLDGQTNLFNGGVRWAALPGLRIDAAYAGFQQFAFGASYKISIP
jgi:hypothetical protein